MHQQIYFYHEKHAQALSKLKLARRRQSPHHLQLEYYDILHWPIAYQKPLKPCTSAPELETLLEEVQRHA